jgi:metallophosphoesterase (TIGR03768 family)
MRKTSRLMLSLLMTLLVYVSSAQSQTPSYPIAPDVFTTRQQVVIPDAPTPSETIFPYEIDKYEANGYGRWHYEAGINAGRQTGIMGTGYDANAFTNTAKLLSFFTFTDIHLTDEESPVQAVYSGYKGGNSSAYSPVMMLTVQVLDAAVQTINALHKRKPFDFGLSIGDVANGSQYNELRWYIDVLDGQKVNPDSGIDDDPVPGPHNDYEDEFQAAGLDDSIPWYQTLGNHDHSWLGSYPVTDYLRPFYTGLDILLMGDLITDGPDSRVAYLGSFDGSTPNGTLIGCGVVADFPDGSPQVHAADANRRPLSRGEYMNEFFTTTSNPPGHGFDAANVASGSACYSFDPKPGMPVKVIVLDDTQFFDVEGMDENFNVQANGWLNQDRFNWLIGELEEGQANDQLMIISAHVPLSLIGYQCCSPITAATATAKLQEYPNVLMWISGHVHRNLVTPHPSTDPAHPENGFWEIEPASLRDFPQQFRTFEILRNSDKTVSVMITDVDPAAAPGSLAEKSRSFAIASDYLFNEHNYYPPSDAYNAELIKQLSPDMQLKMQNYGTPLGTSDQAQWCLYE